MTKCVLCFKEHDRLWEGKPNMYCEACWSIREAARGTISHIIGPIYLGDMSAASDIIPEQNIGRMCVHENGPTYDGFVAFNPILEKRPNSSIDRTGAVVSIPKIEEAANIIEYYFKNNHNLLVHCYGGVERSPLTVAYWLTKYNYFRNIDESYEFLKWRRPVISPRLFWFPETHELFRKFT